MRSELGKEEIRYIRKVLGNEVGAR